ncbi:site-specific integrase [Sedimentibacter sp. zth1]|uniref:tyrosine-type recombinase/integrase n=1 Tax=Sedimentibacter sp. zth1 TaxID=2816908 RepID=UPI001A91750D|nr:site-specific integrase [Sedimentibacter sp. zth1]QSX06775.1 site-specific integrase [Sedimentibacter sp. zth1]
MKYFDYIDEYINYKKFKSPSSKRMYKLALKLFYEFIYKNNIKLDIDNSYFSYIMDKFKDYLKASYTNASINSFVKVIINYFNYLDMKGYIVNFHNNVQTIDNKVVSKDEIISKDDFNKIIDFLEQEKNYQKQFLFYIALYTGLKAKYLIKLKYSDFLYNEKGKFVFRNKILKINPFDIELPEEIEKIYFKLLDSNNINQNNAYILLNSYGHVYTDRYLRKVFQDTCENAKVKKFTPSCFRHSAVYYYIKQNGYDKSDVAIKFNWSKDNYDRMYKNLFKESIKENGGQK